MPRTPTRRGIYALDVARQKSDIDRIPLNPSNVELKDHLAGVQYNLFRSSRIKYGGEDWSTSRYLKNTVSLLRGVKIVYDFAHPVKGAVVRIDGENAAFVHMVWKTVIRLVLRATPERRN